MTHGMGSRSVVRRLRTWLAFVAALAVAIGIAAPARAETITPESVEGKNIRVAEDFIRGTGNTALADNIEQFLVAGTFSVDDLSGKAGVTSAFNNITLDPSVVRPAAQNVMGPKAHFALILALAATLTHEKRHAHQSVRDKLNPWWKEYDAWGTEVLEIDKWVDWLWDKYQASGTKEDLEHLQDAVNLKKKTLDEFIDDMHCLGYGCDSWTRLRATIVKLQTTLAAEKPKKGDPAKNGAIVGQAKQDEQTAQSQIPPSGTPPPAPPPLPPGASPTHRVTSCPACQDKATALNDTSDLFALSQSPARDRVALQADVARLAKELDDCEANQCPKKTTPPQVGMVTPANGSTGTPSSPGVMVAVRAGIALPFGSAASGDSLGDGISLAIPILLEGGYRFPNDILVGAYFGWGPTFPKCADSVSCSGYDMRFGIEGAYRFHATPTITPWAGLASGYEILHGSSSIGAASGSSSLSGFELLTLQGGADYRVSDALGVGGFLSFSFGKYTNLSFSPDVPGFSGSIANTTFHEWVTLGARGTYDIPLK